MPALAQDKMSNVDSLKSIFKQHQQDQVFQFWNQLSPEKQESLLQQLRQIDPERVNQIFTQTMLKAKQLEQGVAPRQLEPLPAECFANVDQVAAEQIAQWKQTGLKAVQEGKVGVILLAGGQGTRLGSSAPKGCYDIGLPSKKSLFQLQAERIHRLQQMSGSASIVIPWYIMTSGPTRADTEAFFQKQNYFGLNKQNIIFFEQGVLPAFTLDGKIIMEDMDKVSVAPDGNGGVYAALRTSGVLDDMSKRGIQYLHAYCVDNCLVRVADPIFLGFCISKGAKCGAKVVRKVEPAEPVGVVCKVNGKYGVVEYSEISKEDSEKKRQDGTLSYDAANIANHYYSLDFLKQVCTREFEQKLDYHVAHKKIKHIDPATNQMVAPSKPNGVKMELFIFDIFPFLDAKSFFVLSVPRSAEFSPLKNAPGAGAGCPETSRRDIFAQSVRFLKALGCEVKASGAGVEKIVDKEYPIFEISPLVSYDGESLEFTKGKSISISKPTYVNSVDELKSLLV